MMMRKDDNNEEDEWQSSPVAMFSCQENVFALSSYDQLCGCSLFLRCCSTSEESLYCC